MLSDFLPKYAPTWTVMGRPPQEPPMAGAAPESLVTLALNHYKGTDSLTQYARALGRLGGILTHLESHLDSTLPPDVVLANLQQVMATARKSLTNG
jgi:hypothetical protein